jgi:hypothetical protein
VGLCHLQSPIVERRCLQLTTPFKPMEIPPKGTAFPPGSAREGSITHPDRGLVRALNWNWNWNGVGWRNSTTCAILERMPHFTLGRKLTLLTPSRVQGKPKSRRKKVSAVKQVGESPPSLNLPSRLRMTWKNRSPDSDIASRKQQYQIMKLVSSHDP